MASRALEAAHDTRRRLDAAASREEAAELAVDIAGELLACDVRAVAVERDGRLAFEATATADGSTFPSDALRAVADQTYRSGEPVHLDDCTRDELDAGYRSLLCVPLGEHGVLQCVARGPSAFDDDALALAEMFGGYVTRVLDALPGETQSRPSAKQAREFVEIADVMLVAIDADGTVTLANRKAREVLGYGEGELVGRDWFDTCVPERNREAVREVFEGLMAGESESVERYQNPVVTAEGEERIVEWHNTVLREDGEPTGTLSSGLDITAQKEREQALREEREKYSTLVENSNDGITIIQDGEFKFVNERFAEFHETTPEKLVGEPFLSHIDPEYRDLVEERYEKRMAGESPPARYEVEILDGEMTLEINAARIEHEGRPADMGIVRDVTEDKHAREQLREERDRREALFRNPSDSIIEIEFEDATPVIQAMNETFTDVFGYESQDVVGRPVSDALVPDDETTRRRHAEIKARVREGETVNTEVKRQTRDGPRDFLLRVFPIDIADGHRGSYAIYTDITEQKERERELERSRRRYRTLVDQFPNGVVSLFDENHRYQVAGGTGFEQLDISPDDLEGKRLEEVFPPENVDRVEPLYRRVFEGESSTAELLFGGRVFRIHIVPVYDEDGEIFAGMTMSQDVTEQRAHQEKLEAARKRYRTLLQAAPDPIFVADADTGEIVEANEAAETLRGEPREEIVGRHQPELHPADAEAAYRRLFEEAVEEGGTWRRLEDGSPIHVTTRDGERIPVEISVENIEISGERIIYGIFRDISDRIAYERMLTGLNEATRDLFDAETSADVGRFMVETVTEVLDLSGAAFYRFEENDGMLRPGPRSISRELEDRLDELPVFEPGEGIAWRVFRDGEAVVCEDVRTHEDVYNSETPIRSEVVVPIGEWGVLLAGDPRPGIFEERDVDLVEVLGATAEAALERVDRDQELRRREQQLRERSQQLEDAEEVNAQIRNVARAIVESETRQEIEQAVCDELVGADAIDFAWIGDIDPVENRLDPRAWAGEERGYFTDVSLALDGETAEPAVRAAETRECSVVGNTATEVAEQRWRSEAIEREFRSVMSIPLVYQEAPQGVLTLYAPDQSAFDDVLRPVLSELGDLIANAVAAVDRKHAVATDRATELEFDVRDRSCFLLQCARETGYSLELEGTIPQSDGSWIVFLDVDDESPDTVLEYAEQSAAIGSARLIETGGDTSVQLRFVEPFAASMLAEQGLTLRSAVVDAEQGRITVAVPPQFDIRRAVDTVSTMYPDSELLAKREQRRSLETTGGALSGSVLEKLTPRQLEVAETAYFSGYFESPRKANGTELAEELGFSTSAFHHHIRTAERKLFEAVFEEQTSASTRSRT